MRSKRFLIRGITRFLYAGGFVFLVAGLLLSALSSSAFAAGPPSLDPSRTDTPPGTQTVSKSSPNINCPVTATPIRVTPTKPNVIPSFTPAVTKTQLYVIPSFTPAVTETQPVEIPSFTPTTTVMLPSKIPTPTVTRTTQQSVTPSLTATTTTTRANTPTTTLTAQPGIIGTPTSTATHIVTLAPPERTITSAPVLIPVTGVDLTRPIGANGLSIFGSLITNIGLFSLGMALVLTGISSQIKN